jgi:cobalt/nickel transport system permease protein
VKKKLYVLLSALFSFLIVLLAPREAYAMHIMEGFLPPMWAAIWFVVSIPVLLHGVKSIKKLTDENPNIKMLLALCGAFAFVLSAMKLPSVTGSSSHPTGVGLGAILFGPSATSILGLIVLLFQAILLAHGGISTLGANVFSMGIAGPIVSYLAFRTLNKSGASKGVSVFIAAALGNLITYIVTSIQLGLAFPGEVGIMASIVKFLGIFAVTQVPLAISEGLLTVVIYNLLTKYNENELNELSLIREVKS